MHAYDQIVEAIEELGLSQEEVYAWCMGFVATWIETEHDDWDTGIKCITKSLTEAHDALVKHKRWLDS